VDAVESQAGSVRALGDDPGLRGRAVLEPGNAHAALLRSAETENTPRWRSEGLDGWWKRKEQRVRVEKALEQATRPSRMLAGRTRWLVVRDGGNPLELLCVYTGSQRVLPVFSFEEEARLFLRLGGYDGRWRARESCADELVSVLYGPSKGVKSVALDPLPEMLEDGTLALVGVGRERFLEQIFLTREKRTAP
jgi:hypothetical protein